MSFPDPGTVNRIELAVTPANSAYVYAIIGNSNDGFEGLYLSSNSGVDFTQQSNSPNILHANASPGVADEGGQATHDLAIVASPLYEDLITIGGINQWQSRRCWFELVSNYVLVG